MSSTRADHAGLVIGGEPRIDFLPPEIKAGKQAKRTRRLMVALVVVVAAIVAAGYLFATTLAITAQQTLAAEERETERLLAEQEQYADARDATRQTVATKNARLVALATELEWKAILDSVQATLPEGFYIVDYAAVAENPFEGYLVTDRLLQEPRVAGIAFSAASLGLPQVDAWLVNLSQLPFYADAYVTSIELDDGTGLYEVKAVLNIDASALAHRYVENADDGIAAASDEEDE